MPQRPANGTIRRWLGIGSSNLADWDENRIPRKWQCSCVKLVQKRNVGILSLKGPWGPAGEVQMVLGELFLPRESVKF